MGGRLGLFLLGWVMVLAGALLAHLVQTSGGVHVIDVRYPGLGGERLSALLYVPPTATPSERATTAQEPNRGFASSRASMRSIISIASRRSCIGSAPSQRTTSGRR